MKLLFILSLLGFVFQSVGQNIWQNTVQGVERVVGQETPRDAKGNLDADMFLQPMLGAYASEIAQCDVSDLDISSLANIKQICKSLIESKVCTEIEPQYRMDCDNIDLDMGQIEINRSDIESSLRGCAVGGMEGAVEGAIGIWTLIKIGSGFTVDTMIGDFEWSNEVVDNTKSAWNNIIAEADRLEEEEQVDPRISFVKAAFYDPMVREYKEYGCLNNEGQDKVMCHIAMGVAMVLGPGYLAKKVGKRFAPRFVGKYGGMAIGGAGVATGALGFIGGLTALLGAGAVKASQVIIRSALNRVKKSGPNPIAVRATERAVRAQQDIINIQRKKQSILSELQQVEYLAKMAETPRAQMRYQKKVNNIKARLEKLDKKELATQKVLNDATKNLDEALSPKEGAEQIAKQGDKPTPTQTPKSQVVTEGQPAGQAIDKRLTNGSGSVLRGMENEVANLSTKLKATLKRAKQAQNRANKADSSLKQKFQKEADELNIEAQELQKRVATAQEEINKLQNLN